MQASRFEFAIMKVTPVPPPKLNAASALIPPPNVTRIKNPAAPKPATKQALSSEYIVESDLELEESSSGDSSEEEDDDEESESEDDDSDAQPELAPAPQARPSTSNKHSYAPYSLQFPSSPIAYV